MRNFRYELVYNKDLALQVLLKRKIKAAFCRIKLFLQTFWLILVTFSVKKEICSRDKFDYTIKYFTFSACHR